MRVQLAENIKSNFIHLSLKTRPFAARHYLVNAIGAQHARFRSYEASNQFSIHFFKLIASLSVLYIFDKFVSGNSIRDYSGNNRHLLTSSLTLSPVNYQF